ncbi:MAG: hypothetical protein WBA41_04000 [Rivularia sp. (in: cyanobacteria)]
MKEVLELIEKRKQEFAKLPFFEYLQDKSIDPRQRLIWVPCFTHVTMSLAELNKYILRQKPNNNPIQEIINKHTYEEDYHWIWFLGDIEKLDFNNRLNFIDAINFFWSESTQKTRQLSYELFSLCTSFKDPILRLIIIEAIEGTSNVGLPLTAIVAQELEQITDKDYLYLNNHHVEAEKSHTIIAGNTHLLIDNLQLTPKQKETAFNIVNTVFLAFSECFNELMIYAQTHSVENFYIETNSEEKSLILA